MSRWSTLRGASGSYSVPSRLIGQMVKARLYEDHLEVWFAQRMELSCERLRGEKRFRIDYRHVIWSLVRKPGALARYIYREEMFPSLVFRKAYDAIHSARQGLSADLEYLRILHLAASTLETDVELALGLLLAEGHSICVDAIKALVAPPRAEIPELMIPPVDLSGYDALIGQVGT